MEVDAFMIDRVFQPIADFSANRGWESCYRLAQRAAAGVGMCSVVATIDFLRAIYSRFPGNDAPAP